MKHFDKFRKFQISNEKAAKVVGGALWCCKGHGFSSEAGGIRICRTNKSNIQKRCGTNYHKVTLAHLSGDA